MAYVTKQEVKNYLGITWSSGLDTFIDTLIAAATKYVEEYCGDLRYGKRVFEAPDPDDDVTRYFDGNDEERLQVGDVRSLTSLTVDGVALTSGDDFNLLPYNAAADEKPFTAIELVQLETSFARSNPRRGHAIPYVFERLQKSVVLVGKFGYSATPPADVKVAVMKLVGGIIKENIGDSDLKEVTSETLGEYSQSFAKIKDIAHALGIGNLLAPYKRGRISGSSRVIQVS